MTKKRKAAVAVLAAAGLSLLIPGIALTTTHSDHVNNIAYAEARETSVWDVNVSSEGNRVAYGAGWGAEAAQKVSDAFKAKWEELNLSGNPAEGIKAYNNDGAGDAVVLGCKVSDTQYLLYNVYNEEVYSVEGAFASKIGELRRIGAPVTNELTGITVTGWDGESNQVNVSGATVQVFETGILIIENSSAVKHEGVIEKISATEYKIHPVLKDQDVQATGKGSSTTADGKNLGFIGDIDGTWHALRTARTSRNDGKLVVQFNFRAGCVEVTYNDDWSLSSRRTYAGQNFDYATDGTYLGRVTIPVENFTTEEHLYESATSSDFSTEGGGSYGVTNAALTMYRSLSGNNSASQADVKAAFKEGYLNLLEDGVIAGYRCSVIKTWGVLCVDYKFSPDSSYGFDATGSAGRECMYTLVYSGVQNKVYGVGDDIWNLWRDDNTRKALGAPISNQIENITISGITFKRIQLFESGYVYENSKGALVVEYGVTTDNSYANFEYTAAPTEKPSQYGSETERFTATENNRKVVYINYEKGAVKATESYAKLGYFYEYYPGRNFEANDGKYTAKLLTYEQLYNDSDFNCNSAYTDIFNDGFDATSGAYVKGVKTQIIEKVKELLNAGFFPGFLESNFQSWNLVACQQFIYGDSTANPWGGDSRTNVCALIYNTIEGKVYLLKDAFMDLWGGTQAYTQLGAPAGEEFKVAGNANLTFQYFYGAASQNNKAFAVSVGYNEATYYTPSDAMASEINPEKYVEGVKDLTRPLAGVTIEEVATNVKVGGYAYIDYIIDGAAADATVTITSSDESVAEVMADDSVEFRKAGTATITVTVTDGVNTFTDTITFTVS